MSHFGHYSPSTKRRGQKIWALWSLQNYTLSHLRRVYVKGDYECLFLQGAFTSLCLCCCGPCVSCCALAAGCQAVMSHVDKHLPQFCHHGSSSLTALQYWCNGVSIYHLDQFAMGLNRLICVTIPYVKSTWLPDLWRPSFGNETENL